jgi:hypothetical protein
MHNSNISKILGNCNRYPRPIKFVLD